MTPADHAVDKSAETAAPRVWPLHLAAFLATYIFSVVNIAAPDIQESLGADEAQVSLVLGTYSAAFGAGIIVCGRLGDRYGRRRLFLWGIAALAVTSIAVAAAPTVGLLILGRLAQGLSAAVMMPQILAIIQATLTGGPRLRAVGLFSAFSGVGTVAGQILGGAILSLDPWELGWRAALGSSTLIALLALLGGLRLRETVSEHRAGFDFSGSLLLGIALVALIAGLSLGPANGWPWWAWALVGGGLAGLALLAAHQVWREKRGRSTVLPPSVVRIPAIAIGIALSMVFFGGFGSFIYSFAMLTQQHLGLTPIVAGAGLTLFAGVFVVASLFSSRFTAALGGPRTLILGATVQALALAATAGVSALAGADAWIWWFQIPAAFLGFGQALMFAPLVATVMAAVPDRVAGLTGGFISTGQQTGLGIGVATLSMGFVALASTVEPLRAFGIIALVQITLSVLFIVLAARLAVLTRRPGAALTSPAVST